MRGKLRDKRVASKRDATRRDVFERRRPYKRDSRSVQWLDQQTEEKEEEYTTSEEAEVNTAPAK